ncbi:MAG: hypothetical protein H6563_10890 [Lewinellaceae bacterium]|nr:hypothetical protein [Lewinellaceae bacterium]
MLERRTFKLEKDDSVLLLEIPSRNFFIYNYFFLILALVFLGVAIMLPIVPVYFPMLHLTWWLVVPLMILFFFLTYRAFSLFVWVEKGFEFLKLDRATGQAYYWKKGLWIFGSHTMPLLEIGEFYWCPENEAIVDDSHRYGLAGGRLCFRISGERHRIGVALTKSEAKYCLVVLNRFLKNADL